MFRYTCSFVVLASAALATGFVYVPGPVSYDCLKCICHEESNCMIPDPLCRDDRGSESCGPYQIKNAYWIDANQTEGNLDGDWKNCAMTFTCSARAVQAYMKRYAPDPQTLPCNQVTCEIFARMHNGGPTGYKKSGTLDYWEKVKACLP